MVGVTLTQPKSKYETSLVSVGLAWGPLSIAAGCRYPSLLDPQRMPQYGKYCVIAGPFIPLTTVTRLVTVTERWKMILA